jgi:hypothetical protein
VRDAGTGWGFDARPYREGRKGECRYPAILISVYIPVPGTHHPVGAALMGAEAPGNRAIRGPVPSLSSGGVLKPVRGISLGPYGRNETRSLVLGSHRFVIAALTNAFQPTVSTLIDRWPSRANSSIVAEVARARCVSILGWRQLR